MNYRNEQEHDILLIDLVKDLAAIGNTMLIQTMFGIPTQPAKLERACRHKAFDVELTFSNLSIVIETKVDSDESGRWNSKWQTEKIYQDAQSLSYLKSEKYFIFITYGTSEFYTKPFAPGPASSNFIHLGLEKMISLGSSALTILPSSLKSKYEEWIHYMQIEQEKRNNALSLLAEFDQFRNAYLSIHKDVDFPNSRLKFCAPELAFPLFGAIANLWNSNPEYHKTFGKVAVYPVSRSSPAVHDSILNFWELWERGEPSLGGIMVESHGKLYFEMNEDFNLNLKLDSGVLPTSFQETVYKKLEQQEWPTGVTARPRQYKQATYVLYEWDFGLLKNLMNLPEALNQLSKVLLGALKALS